MAPAVMRRRYHGRSGVFKSRTPARTACNRAFSRVELTRQFRNIPMSYMRSPERRGQILACAKRVFAQRGFHAANVSHICEAAGIGRGTLYLYFANKRSVLAAILRETLDRVRALMESQTLVTFPLVPVERVSRGAAIEVAGR